MVKPNPWENDMMEPVEIARPPQSWGYVRELEEVRNEQEGE